MLEQYGIEFNEAAKQHTNDPKALRRLMKGNVGLFVVLEDSGRLGSGRRWRKRQFCVANVHTYWNPDFADIKLWQTWILCQELENLVIQRNLPLLLCGDFNSMQDSAVYELLATSRVPRTNAIFTEKGDPKGILPSAGQLSHQLGLTSSYHSVLNREPTTTNFTDKFSGVLDYIWFSGAHLQALSVVDVDDKEVLERYTALPSPLLPSDHIALVCQLDWLVD